MIWQDAKMLILKVQVKCSATMYLVFSAKISSGSTWLRLGTILVLIEYRKVHNDLKHKTCHVYHYLTKTKKKKKSDLFVYPC